MGIWSEDRGDNLCDLVLLFITTLLLRKVRYMHETALPRAQRQPRRTASDLRNTTCPPASDSPADHRKGSRVVEDQRETETTKNRQ